MKYMLDLELRQYRQTVIDSLPNSTRQRALIQGRQDDDLSAFIGGLNYVGSSIAGIGSSLSEIAPDLARLAAAVDSALPGIVEYLAISTREITDISRMMATPEETRAAERYRKGTLALSSAQKAGSPARMRQWYEFAVHDLTEAVEIHRYHAQSWFNLGIALGRLGRNEEAAEAFASCGFFGVDDSLEFGATAVLLAAGLYRQADLRDKSAEILHEYLGQLDRCAEIHLALAVHHGESDQLTTALGIYPYLAADALAANAPIAESVILQFCKLPDGPVKHLPRLQQAIRSLADRAIALELPNVSRIPVQDYLTANGIEALFLALAALPSTQAMAKRLVIEVNDSLHQLEREAEAADQNVVQAKADESRRLSIAYHHETQRIARMREVGIARAASTLKATLLKYGRRNPVYDAERREADATYEWAVRTVNEECDRAVAELRVPLAIEAQVPANAARIKSERAIIEVAEPRDELEHLLRATNMYSSRIVPFKLQGF